MANRFTTSAAPPGLDGLVTPGVPDELMSAQLAADAAAMVADLGEPVVYYPSGNTSADVTVLEPV